MLIATVLTVATLVAGGTGQTSKPEATVKCEAHKAIKFYSARIAHWSNKMGAPVRFAAIPPRSGCPQYLAKVLRTKAYAAKKRYEAWEEYHFHWWKWLPAKWQRIARCETHKGQYVPGDWRHNSGTYQGAFGFYHGTWDGYKPEGFPAEAYQATPRQQYIVALNVYAEHGYGAWGCGGA